MASPSCSCSSSLYNFLIFFSLILFPISTAQTSFRPKALLLRVTKDLSTLQYTTHIAQGTPQVPVKLTLDLGGEFLWVDCENGFNSSSRKPVPCNSAQCHLRSHLKACATYPNKTGAVCSETPVNTVVEKATSGDFVYDIVSVPSTDGTNPGRAVSVPKLLFTCAPTFLLEGLANGVKGMAGLGRFKVSLPLLFSAAFSFPRKFAVCLSSSTKGAIIFGDGPYVLNPKIDVSKSLIYTPLIPVKEIGNLAGELSSEYYIGVKSIKINGKPVSLNRTLLSVDGDGHGGTKISTVHPYTVLETSIYNAVVDAFVKELGNGVVRVAPVSPFGACFRSKNIGVTRAGAAVPQIDLVLQSEKVVWSILGANSMVRVSNDLLCLGFVDGGPIRFVDWGVKFTRTAIVIGGHQIEDNLLQFDLAASKLGFSSSLLLRQTSCSNFNFTSIA
ncbi:hypothetical protein TIFTF001_015788 [Ficus carica]|uniref:Peptidase A1 domain-containing protein n=1 Tax=Ficus carica TaxID=3494 RepID=A0AA88AIC7_FICCA|nr:hypothetical protein TIFTF001_015788 [Ficus carica]